MATTSASLTARGADRTVASLPIATLIALAGIVVFGSDLLEVSLRGGPLEPLIGLTYLGLYALGAALAVVTRALPQALLANPLLALLLLLPWCSALWSVDPAMTLWRAMMLTGTTVFALFLGWHYSLARLVRLLAIGIGCNVLLSAFLVFAVPGMGIDQTAAWAGAWVGAYMHKNGFGAAMSVAVVILLFAAAAAAGLIRLALLALGGLAAVLLIGSQSATGLVVALSTLLLGGLLILWQQRRRFCLALGIALLASLPILALLGREIDFLGLALATLQKDVTAHGRTEIWQLVWPYITDRFWLGYGYGSFWQPGFPWFSQLEARLRYTPYYSHNGLVELWIAGGTLTVLVFLGVFLVAFVKAAIQALAGGRTVIDVLPWLLLVGFAFRNVTEASILQANDFLWLLFVVMATAASRSVVFRAAQPTAARPDSAVLPS